MALFGKKKEEPPSGLNEPGGADLYNLVLDMRSKGMSDDQIVQQLQQKGYDMQKIFDAMSQADVVPNNAPQNFQQGPFYGGEGEFQQPPLRMQEMQPQEPISADRIEEIAETIIEEKWEELERNINKIVEWKNSMDTRINKIEEDIKNLKEEFTKIHEILLGKLKEYDKNIVNVGTEIRAMEKVFQKVLPVFTQNINELSRITKALKKSKKSKK